MPYDAKYNPNDLNYLKGSWDGVVTANDLAIQNQPWSLGHQQGATPEQLAQQEREKWFRDRGLDPNRYEGAAPTATPPQPGFNPAGGAVNTGKPLQQQVIASDGRTAGEFKALQKANKQFEKQNGTTIDRKAAAAAGAAYHAANAGTPSIQSILSQNGVQTQAAPQPIQAPQPAPPLQQAASPIAPGLPQYAQPSPVTQMPITMPRTPATGIQTALRGFGATPQVGALVQRPQRQASMASILKRLGYTQ